MDKETYDKRLAEAKEAVRQSREHTAGIWREDGVDEAIVQKFLATGKLPMKRGIVSAPKKSQESKKPVFVEEGLIRL